MNPRGVGTHCHSTCKNQQSKIRRLNFCGDGRLGRPSEGEAERHRQQPLPRDHPLPVCPPGQRRTRLRHPTLLAKAGHCRNCGRPRVKQPVQRGTGTRQRRILCACAQKRTLAFTQLGIFRKDDLFKVVLNPGPDKREKRILGPAPSKRSTGERFTQPCR